MARFFHNRHYHQLKCWACGSTFTAWFSNAKFCSVACRKFAHRAERAGQPWHFQFTGVTFTSPHNAIQPALDGEDG